jgi:hypothetical protein
MIEFRKKLFLFYVAVFTIVYLSQQLAAEQDVLMAKASTTFEGLTSIIK